MSQLTTEQRKVVRPTHDNTPTSRKNVEIEKELMRSLNDIVNRIKAEINPTYAWIELENKYKIQYNTRVYDLIREAATQSYLLGSEFVAINISDKIPVFLTESDLKRIKAIAEDHTGQFWGRMKISTSKQALQFYFGMSTNQRPADSFLNPNFIVTSIAIGVTNIALNVATIAKRKDLIDKYRISLPELLQQRQRRLMQFQAEEIDPDNFDELGVEDVILSIDPDTVLMLDSKLTWVTSQDELVCPECESLEGDYEIDDPSLPLPDIDSHPNCRCRLIPG